MRKWSAATRLFTEIAQYQLLLSGEAEQTNGGFAGSDEHRPVHKRGRGRNSISSSAEIQTRQIERCEVPIKRRRLPGDGAPR
jgi:hypothetical protein